MTIGLLTGRALAALFTACTLTTACTTQMVRNEGQAMAPTFNDGDGALVSRRFETIERGDNRRNSSDSRHWGPVRRDAIWGKVI